jgi:hypothetical protein
MARKTAGRKYPYATTEARQHDHRFCPVVQTIAQLAQSGAEPWGTIHPMPAAATLDQAEEAKRGLYRARKHGWSIRAIVRKPGEQLASGVLVPAGQYVVEVQVWTRALAKQHIATKVQAGQPLAYNVMRRDAP